MFLLECRDITIDPALDFCFDLGVVTLILSMKLLATEKLLAFYTPPYERMALARSMMLIVSIYLGFIRAEIRLSVSWSWESSRVVKLSSPFLYKHSEPSCLKFNLTSLLCFLFVSIRMANRSVRYFFACSALTPLTMPIEPKFTVTIDCCAVPCST